MAIILLLDDNAVSLASLSFALEEAGHRVYTGCHGVHGLSMLSRLFPEVVVTDWQMPVMDGLEFCDQIRQRVVFRNTPIILVSGALEPVDSVAQVQGWNVFFRKPIPLQDLIRTVEVLTRRAKYAQHTDAGGGPVNSRWAAVRAVCWP
ncbi:response regulator (plasmid) [Caballeronia sp. NK8]|nr:response regulator [Caballeronia sp. NK8]